MAWRRRCGCGEEVLWAALLLQCMTTMAAVAPVVVAGPVSRAEDARLFHIYYGQGFKVIKNTWDGKSYLLLQNTSKMAAKTKYCTGRIKSFVIPIASYSVDTTASPVSFFEIKTNYLCLSKAAANLSTRFKPIVAWIEYTEGVWTFVKESYKLQYVTDAGAEIVDATITDKRFNISDPEDMDNLHAILCTVDVVIDQTYASDPAEYKLSTFLENINVVHESCFSFITNQSIWRFDKRIGVSNTLDWFDGAMSQPQLVLADLTEIFFQTGNYTTIYFRNLAKEEGVTELNPAMCSRSISTPMEPTILSCQ